MLATLSTYREQPVLIWRGDGPRLVASSAALGGGIDIRRWILNLTVPIGYQRNDPDVHLAEVAAALALDGPGVGLMTAVDVARRVTAADGGVVVTATVGLNTVGWAAAPDGDRGTTLRPGTVNIVAHLPARLGEAALVNAVATATEAKTQALWELGVAATGTATDAVAICCPPDGEAEAYGGPRSTWGARLARAVYAAVRDGAAADLGIPR